MTTPVPAATPLTAERIEHLRKLAAALKGPWEFVPQHVAEGPAQVRHKTEKWLLCCLPGDVHAELITELLNHAPALFSAPTPAEPRDAPKTWAIEHVGLARVGRLTVEPFRAEAYESENGFSRWSLRFGVDQIRGGECYGTGDFEAATRRAKEELDRALALLAPRPARPDAGEAVAQFRAIGCADWYDGLPDHKDGGGPYETRILYTHPPAASAETARVAVDQNLLTKIDDRIAWEKTGYDHDLFVEIRAALGAQEVQS